MFLPHRSDCRFCQPFSNPLPGNAFPLIQTSIQHPAPVRHRQDYHTLPPTHPCLFLSRQAMPTIGCLTLLSHSCDHECALSSLVLQSRLHHYLSPTPNKQNRQKGYWPVTLSEGSTRRSHEGIPTSFLDFHSLDFRVKSIYVSVNTFNDHPTLYESGAAK